jgi:hypothetical protein
MGKFVSTITDGINSIAQDICSSVTDAGKTLEQLTQITQDFTPPILRRGQLKAALDSTDLPDALKNSITSAQSAAKTAFTAKFPSDDPNCNDSGVVQGYQTGGDVSSVVKQITKIFNDNQIDADSKTIGQMASTIQTEVDAHMGLRGTATGSHAINMNQSLEWSVAYAIFAIDENTNGLVYGFAAAMTGGWKKKS